jgi:hypothetical protein
MFGEHRRGSPRARERKLRGGAGGGECHGGQDVDELGGHRRGQLRHRALARWCQIRSVTGSPTSGAAARGGQDPPPGGDAFADEHPVAERERGRPGMQDGMPKVLVTGVEAGVRPVAGNTVLAGIRGSPRFSSRSARRRWQGQ